MGGQILTMRKLHACKVSANKRVSKPTLGSGEPIRRAGTKQLGFGER